MSQIENSVGVEESSLDALIAALVIDKAARVAHAVYLDTGTKEAWLQSKAASAKADVAVAKVERLQKRDRDRSEFLRTTLHRS